MMLPKVAGALTAAGAAGVTTAAVLAWKLAVEKAGVAAAVTVGDALVVGKLAAAASCGRDAADAAGAVVLATLTETFEVVAPLVGEPAAEDPRRGVDTEMFELLLLASGVDFVACADDDAEVCPGVDAVVEGPEAAVVVALGVEVLGLEVAVVGSVLVVPVPVTEVLAPPVACTTPARGSVDDPDWVEDFVDAWLDDDAVPVLVGAVLGDDDADDADATVEFEEEPDDGEPADVEPLDEELLEELLEEPVDEEPLGSASAIAGLLAIATPNPSVTANAPTRPT
jgi:hypothetical protein